MFSNKVIFKLHTEEETFCKFKQTAIQYGALSIQPLLCVCIVGVQNVKESPPPLSYSSAYSGDAESSAPIPLLYISCYTVVLTKMDIACQLDDWKRRSGILMWYTLWCSLKIKIHKHCFPLNTSWPNSYKKSNSFHTDTNMKQTKPSFSCPSFFNWGLPVSSITSLENYQVIISSG